ncbi:hypothetical protein ABQE44_23690 [Mycolicibacterium sp. XJ2546]
MTPSAGVEENRLRPIGDDAVVLLLLASTHGGNHRRAISFADLRCGSEYFFPMYGSADATPDPTITSESTTAIPTPTMRTNQLLIEDSCPAEDDAIKRCP